MAPSDDTTPTPEILPVSEDMLLTEEELERVLNESRAPFELSQAILRFDEPHAATASADESGGAGVSDLAQTTARHGRSESRTSGKRPPLRSRGKSPARWIFVGMAVVCLAGAGIWLALPPSPDPHGKRRGAADLLAQSQSHPVYAGGKLDPVAALAAGIFAADLFDYPPQGELKGQTGGVGWAGPWSAPKAMTAPGSLTAGKTTAGGTGGHVSLEAAEQISITRAYGSPGVPDPKTGGEWWASLLVSHTGGTEGDGGELWINFFSDSNVNSVIRLTLTEKGRTLQLRGGGKTTPVTIPGEPGTAVRLLARIQAKPVSNANFDFLMDVWVNPDKAPTLAPPDLSLTAKGAALPSHAGFSIQKQLQNSAGITRLDGLILARTAAAIRQ